jgi:hypothetical protein
LHVFSHMQNLDFKKIHESKIIWEEEEDQWERQKEVMVGENMIKICTCMKVLWGNPLFYTIIYTDNI